MKEILVFMFQFFQAHNKMYCRVDSKIHVSMNKIHDLLPSNILF